MIVLVRALSIECTAALLVPCVVFFVAPGVPPPRPIE